MKNSIAVLVSLIVSLQINAQTTYTVSSNKSWNGNYPGYCNTCTFNISTGVTLTLNTGATCYNCTINGGTVTMTEDFTFQQSAFSSTTLNLGSKTLKLQNNGTSFTNSIINGTGSSNLEATGSLSATGSTFNFSGTAEFVNNGGTFNITSSNLYFYGNSDFKATAGPVNLNTNSQIVAGDGTKGSKAYILINGPTLNLVDAGSALYAANVNNYYANWSAYKSLSNSKTYTTTSNGKNCGGTGQNSCSAQLFYGCASFSSLGPVTCTTLALSITDFKGYKTGDAVKLNWFLSEPSLNNYFKVERSTDGIHFTPLTSMEANAISGYTYVDNNLATGENDYRISLINADGKISYSKIISIQNEMSAEINVFPNPSTGGHFYIQTTSTEMTSVCVYKMDGQLLSIHSLNGQLKYSISVPQSQNRQLLVVRVVTKDKASTFGVLSLP